MRHRLPFELTLTAALLLAAVCSQAVALQAAASRRILARHPLTLPEEIADFRRVPAATDITKEDVVERTYGRLDRGVSVCVRQSSAYDQIHDLNDCLIANGRDPKRLATVTLHAAGTKELHASLIATNNGGVKYLSLLWFQSPQDTSPDRWGWRKQLAGHWWHQLPICREYRVVTNCGPSFEEDLGLIEEAALVLNRLPI